MNLKATLIDKNHVVVQKKSSSLQKKNGTSFAAVNHKVATTSTIIIEQFSSIDVFMFSLVTESFDGLFVRH
jgi:hypothetical protein